MEKFKIIRKSLPEGNIYWQSDELAIALEMEHQLLFSLITNIMITQQHKGYDISSHFALRGERYHLSQYACYKVVEEIDLKDENFRREAKAFFYVKDFVGRGLDKEKVHNGIYETKGSQQKYIKKKEIWNIKWGINIGGESDGKGKYMRPVLVLKVMGNLSLVIPLTTQQKEGNSTAIKYYHKLESVSSDTLSSYAMFNQIRVIDQKRYIRKMGKITKEEFTEIKNLLRILYFPEDLEVLALQELLHTSLP